MLWKDKLMNKSEAIQRSISLINMSNIVMVGSHDKNGYPNIKGMLKMKNEGLKTFYFSTNTSSKRVAQFKENPKASLYFVTFSDWQGLMLIGEMEVLQDKDLKEKLWEKGFEKYYPLGVDDPDYSVLRFIATKGNYYHHLCNIDFDIDETENL